MSKLLKSKILLGALVVAVVFGAFAFVFDTQTAAAADCSITSTLRLGSKGDQVKCLQSALGLTADGSFGPKTLGGVKVWQASKGLVADGIFGAKSRAAFTGGSVGMTYPAGCTSSAGYSPTTGQKCDSGVSTSLPAGCTSTTGFSPTTGQSCSGGSTVVGTGPVTVMLASDNPASRTLVVDTNPNPDVGEAGADLLHLAFTGSGTVTTVNLQRFGISADSDLNNVYLYDGATRLTDGASVTSGGAVSFTNPSGLFTVNGSKTISVRADVGAMSSGSTVGMKLVSYVSGGSTTTANLSGNLFNAATSANLATISFTDGASTNPSTNTSLNPAKDVVVWGTYTMSVSKDAWLNRLALREVGSIALTDIVNFRLYVDGVMVGSAVPSLDANGYVTFDLTASPVKLLSGSRTFKVMADVLGGSNRTFSFNIRSVADIGLVDNQYGVGLTLGGTKPSAGVQTVTPGSVTVQKDTASPSGNVTLNANDVSLAKYKFTVYGEPVKLDTLYVQAAGTYSNAIGTLRNGRVLINGSQYGSTMNISTTASTTSFTVNTTLPVGENTVEVRADVYGVSLAVLAEDIIQIKLNPGITSNAQGTVSGTLSTVPAAGVTVSANTVTVKAGSLAIGVTTSYPNQTTVVPQVGYKLASFQLTGSSTEAVNLNTFAVDFTTGGTFSAANLTNVTIKYNGVAESSVKGTVSAVAGANTWSVSHTLPAAGSATIDIYADINSSVTSGDTLSTHMSVTGVTASSGASIYTLANGTSNTTGPAVVTTAGQSVTAATGSMSSSLDASSPVAKVLYDQTTNTIGAWKWTATNDTYTLTDATFTLGNATTIVSVSLKDGSNVVATRPGAATVSFTGMSLPIASTTKVLTLEATLGTVGNNAGTSHEAITATLTQYKTTSSTGTSTTSTVSTAAATSYVYAAVPVITQLALPTSVISNGTATLDKFSITSSGGTIGWNKIVFSSTKTSAPTIASPTLWNADSNTQIAGTFTIRDVTNSDALCDATALSCQFIFVPTTEQQISGTVNYAFKATVSSAVVNTDSIQTTIAAPSVLVAGLVNHGFAYNDVDSSGTVNLNDIRYVAVTSVASGYGQANTGVATFAAADDTLDEVRSFGTITTGQTIILTETGAATNVIGAITGTLVSTGGFTCYAYDAANGGGSTTTTIASILSIKCTNGTENRVILNTAPLGPDAGGIQATTITLTTGTYAAGSTVAAADSDVGLTVMKNPSLIWSDLSAVGHSVGTLDWFNDLLIKNLPLDTANLQ